MNISFFMLIFKWDQPYFIRGSHPKVLLRKGALKICSKFTGEHPCRSAISVKLLCNFIEITLPHECSPVNLLHIFRTNFLKNTPGWLLLFFYKLSLIFPKLKFKLEHSFSQFIVRFLDFWMLLFGVIYASSKRERGVMKFE